MIYIFFLIFYIDFVWFFFIDFYLVINLWFIVCFIPRRDETMKSNKMRNEKQYTNGTKKNISKQQQNF